MRIPCCANRISSTGFESFTVFSGAIASFTARPKRQASNLDAFALGEYLAGYAGETVNLRFDPKDITTILVYRQEKNQEVFLTRAHAQSLETEQLALDEALAASRRLRTAGKTITNQSLLQEVLDRDALVATKKSRKERQRRELSWAGEEEGQGGKTPQINLRAWNKDALDSSRCAFSQQIFISSSMYKYTLLATTYGGHSQESTRKHKKASPALLFGQKLEQAVLRSASVDESKTEFLPDQVVEQLRKWNLMLRFTLKTRTLRCGTMNNFVKNMGFKQ